MTWRDIDRFLIWQDLSDDKEVGQEVLQKLRSLNYKTVLTLKSLLAEPMGFVAFERISRLSAAEVSYRLSEKHPSIVLPPPSTRKYPMGHS